MPQVQPLFTKQVDHRVDGLAVAENDLPGGVFALFEQIALASNVLHRKLLTGGHADDETVLLPCQRVDVAFAYELAQLHDADAVGDQLDFAQKVGVKKDRLAFRLEADENLADFSA